jgi:hypothetical protein
MLVELFAAPVRAHSSIIDLIADKTCSEAMQAYVAVLPFAVRHQISLFLVRDMLERQTVVAEPDSITILLSQLAATLIKDQKDGGNVSGTVKRPAHSMDSEDFKEEQILVAKLIHLFTAKDSDKQFLVRGFSTACFDHDP